MDVFCNIFHFLCLLSIFKRVSVSCVDRVTCAEILLWLIQSLTAVYSPFLWRRFWLWRRGSQTVVRGARRVSAQFFEGTRYLSIWQISFYGIVEINVGTHYVIIIIIIIIIIVLYLLFAVHVLTNMTDGPWGPPSLLYSDCRVIHMVMRPRRGVKHPPLPAPRLKKELSYMCLHGRL
jgi:hypothetical protein